MLYQRDYVAHMREKYPPGTRVEVVSSATRKNT